MTAVEFLMKFCLNDLPIEQWNKYNGLFQQAKEMEKQQIIDAYETGDKYKFEIAGEKWFNETYVSKGSDGHIVDTNEMVEDTYKVWECCGMENCICKGSDETKQ